MNPRRIIALFKKDLLDAARNYHVLLLIATPIILSLLFSNLFSESRASTMMPRVGVLAPGGSPLLERLQPKDFGIRIVSFSSRDEMESHIAEGELSFGLILPTTLSSATSPSALPKLTMIYPVETPEYAVERFRATFEGELRKYLGKPAPPLPVELSFEPIGGSTAKQRSFGGDMLPMLILMAMGMIGLLALPLSFAEEREKHTIDAIFLTPTTTTELIIGKCLFSFVLQHATVFAMVALNWRWDGNQPFFWLFVSLGSVMFLLVGLFIAAIAETQASVNAMGSSLFLCFQMVPTLSATNDFLRMAANIVPSTYVLRGIRKALFLDLSKVDIVGDLLILAVVTAVFYLVTRIVFRRMQMA